MGGGWSKGILGFRFGPNLRFETEDLDQAEQKAENLGQCPNKGGGGRAEKNRNVPISIWIL